MPISKVHKNAIFSSISVIETYLQANEIKVPPFQPIAITAVKKSTGWATSSATYKQGLKEIVSSIIKKPIFIKEFDKEDAPGIQGCCLEKERSATIYVNKTLNFCWRRFIVAKELSHLLMNKVDGELRNADRKAFEELLSILVTITPVVKNNIQLSEYIAYYGAMEMLIPKEYIDNNLFELNGTPENIKCPKQVIEARQSDNVTSMFDKIYQDPQTEVAGIREKLHRANQ